MWEPEVTEYQLHSATLTATGKITADDIKWAGSELEFSHSTWMMETTTNESEGYSWLTHDGTLLMFTSDQLVSDKATGTKQTASCVDAQLKSEYSGTCYLNFIDDFFKTSSFKLPNFF